MGASQPCGLAGRGRNFEGTFLLCNSVVAVIGHLGVYLEGETRHSTMNLLIQALRILRVPGDDTYQFFETINGLRTTFLIAFMSLLGGLLKENGSVRDEFTQFAPSLFQFLEDFFYDPNDSDDTNSKLGMAAGLIGRLALVFGPQIAQQVTERFFVELLRKVLESHDRWATGRAVIAVSEINQALHG
jgi:hypothetical protein